LWSARKGFNPRRKGRHSRHPLLAVLAEAQFILHGWLRSGNTGAARGVVPFLQEALAFATESALLAVLFTFNLLSLCQHQTTPNAMYRQSGTLDWLKCASPKLIPPADPLAIGGAMI